MRIKHVVIEEIKEREHSQRKGPRGIDELMDSIKRVGLIHPIVLSEDNVLIVGGNRLEACKRLGWEKIPASYMKDLTDDMRQIVELDENVRRTDLTWQEWCRAVRDLNTLLCSTYPDWNMEQVASYVGYDSSHLGRLIRVANALDSKNQHVIAASGLKAAINTLERETKRRVADETNEMWDAITEQQMGIDDDDSGDVKVVSKSGGKRKPREEAVLHTDFTKWASKYKGPKFNLLHCDFPYGIEHGKSGQGSSKSWGAYDDSEDVYWQLLQSLADNRDKLLYPSAHIIFWFSMRFYTETIEFFHTHMPEMEVDHQPLIWHKSDNKGIIRDAKHTPRNITETAFFITRGNREIIKSVGNCYSAPTQKSKATHISEKPVPVLKHFLQLCCDGYSELLDPTCGSGSALRAAEAMGAKRVLGVERDEEYATDANNQLKEARGLAVLTEGIKE